MFKKNSYVFLKSVPSHWYCRKIKSPWSVSCDCNYCIYFTLLNPKTIIVQVCCFLKNQIYAFFLHNDMYQYKLRTFSLQVCNVLMFEIYRPHIIVFTKQCIELLKWHFGVQPLRNEQTK